MIDEGRKDGERSERENLETGVRGKGNAKRVNIAMDGVRVCTLGRHLDEGYAISFGLFPILLVQILFAPDHERNLVQAPRKIPIRAISSPKETLEQTRRQHGLQGKGSSSDKVRSRAL
jgi:hypothetical protein